MSIFLEPYPFLNQEWIDENEDKLFEEITVQGYDNWRSYGPKEFLSDLGKNEQEFLEAYELMNEKMWYEWEAYHEYQDVSSQVLKHLPERFKDEEIWETQITENTIDEFNQCITDCAWDVGWYIAESLHKFLKIKPSWAHETIKEDWAKLDPPKEIWWDENPTVPTKSRLLYERLEADRYLQNQIDGLWERLEEGNYLEISQGNSTSTIYEYFASGEEYYGPEFIYDEDDCIIAEKIINKETGEEEIHECGYYMEPLSWTIRN